MLSVDIITWKRGSHVKFFPFLFYTIFTPFCIPQHRHCQTSKFFSPVLEKKKKIDQAVTVKTMMS